MLADACVCIDVWLDHHMDQNTALHTPQVAALPSSTSHPPFAGLHHQSGRGVTQLRAVLPCCPPRRLPSKQAVVFPQLRWHEGAKEEAGDPATARPLRCRSRQRLLRCHRSRGTRGKASEHHSGQKNSRAPLARRTLRRRD